MTKLTTEITIEELQYRIHAHENDLTQMWTADYFLNVQNELLALKQAAKNPVAWVATDSEGCSEYNSHNEFSASCGAGTPLYAAPALPKQPVIPEQRQMVPDEIIPDQDNTYDYVDGWNACRAEMLKAQQNEQQNIPENIPAQPVSELRARAISLYKPPFKFDFGYIWDADGQMVADQKLNEDGQILRVRGWGRISYLENPEALQDEVGEIIAIALSDYWNRNIEAAPAQEPK